MLIMVIQEKVSEAGERTVFGESKMGDWILLVYR